MKLPTPIWVALVGGLATWLGYFISNALDRRKAIQLREMEFRLDRYREFLLAFIDEYTQGTFETQLQFVNCTNVILMIGGAGLLKAIKQLVDNFAENDEKSIEHQWTIMDHILLEMRHDLNAPDAEELEKFRFPIIVPDLSRKSSGDSPSRR
jgi:hypothetical protein